MLRNFKSRSKGRLQNQSYYKILQLFQYLNNRSLNTLKDYQWKSLSSILLFSKNFCSFYEKRIPENIDNSQDFSSIIPVLTRTELQSQLKEVRANTLPQGTKSTGSIFSSGSTGTPVEILQTNVTNAWFKACHLRDLAWGGWDLQKNIASIKFVYKPEKLTNTTEDINPHWEPWINHVFVTGQSHIMTINNDPEKQYEWLKRFKPHYLITYPSNLEALLDIMDVKGPLDIESVKTISEPLTTDVRQRAEELFSIRNTYSSQEVGYIASECEYGSLHLHSENNFLEVVKDDGMPCKPGESGRVVITNLVNFYSPIIRYELGDRATLGEPCLCGRFHPTLQSIDGKIHPLFTLPNGRRKNSLEIAISMRKIGGIKHFQVIQEKAVTTVNLVTSPQWNNDIKLKITKMLDQFFEEKTPIRINLIDRIPLHSGKRRHLICLL